MPRLLRSRRLMRAPIYLYRARLGFLLGHRMLLLEHIGRKSGSTRQVVLEVVDSPDPGTYVVVSGFGQRSQWFRNISSEPRVRVAIAGRGPAPATARVLDPAEADRALARYAASHPRAWARMKPVVENTLGSPVSERDTEVPMVALTLDAG